MAATTAVRRRRRGHGSPLRMPITHALLLICGFFWVFPMLWAIAGSLKSDSGFLDSD
jgi:ABC-type glycerol-3-phosphate transport system permease component